MCNIYTSCDLKLLILHFRWKCFFFQASIRKQILAIDSDSTLDQIEKTKRKQNLCLVHNLNLTSVSGTPPTTPGSAVSAMSALAMPFYPPSDTVESVIGKSLVLAM